MQGLLDIIWLALCLVWLVLCLLQSAEAFIHIEGKVPDVEVDEGGRARLLCKTSSDPLDSSHLYIRWRFNGRLLNTTSENSKDSKYIQKSDRNRHALVIRNAQLEDSGEYTCIASLGLDSDSATAILTVRSRPGPPIALEIKSCHGYGAELVWQAGPDHGAHILDYHLQFNTSDMPDVWHDYYETIPGKKLHHFADLAPWGTYTFRLLARNELGVGPPSTVTQTSCTTPPDRPNRNPANVETLTHKKGFLVVEWTPMHRLEFHGPGFRYLVNWRRKGNLVWEEATVADPASGHFEHEVNDVYEVYEIQVKAVNELGEAHQPPFKKIGHSGEDEPLVAPRDFRRDPSKPVEPHRAHFIWEAVENSDKIRGEFRGYTLQYWKSSEGRHKMKEVMVAVAPGNASRPKEQYPVVRAALVDLPANTALRAQVAVRNTHYTGPPSMTIDFRTPEGTPSAVRGLMTVEVEEEHVLLQWLAPDEPNGVLTGFDIGYQPVDGMEVGEVRDLTPRINDPSKQSARITGLQPSHNYRFVVWARTKAGRGKMAYVDVQTKRKTRGSSYYKDSANSSTSIYSQPYGQSWTLIVSAVFLAMFPSRTIRSLTHVLH